MNVEGNVKEGSETPRSCPQERCYEVLPPSAASNGERKLSPCHDVDVVYKHHHCEDEQRDYQGVFQYFNCHYHLSRRLPLIYSHLIQILSEYRILQAYSNKHIIAYNRLDTGVGTNILSCIGGSL